MSTIKSAASNQILITHVSPAGVQIMMDRKSQIIQWNALHDLVGGNWDLRKYPTMIPATQWGTVLKAAMEKAKDTPIRNIEILPHPHNQVRVETIAGEYVGQEMGRDWCGTQHANYRQAKQEAESLRKTYEKRGFSVVLKS